MLIAKVISKYWLVLFKPSAMKITFAWRDNGYIKYCQGYIKILIWTAKAHRPWPRGSGTLETIMSSMVTMLREGWSQITIEVETMWGLGEGVMGWRPQTPIVSTTQAALVNYLMLAETYGHINLRYSMFASFIVLWRFSFGFYEGFREIFNSQANSWFLYHMLSLEILTLHNTADLKLSFLFGGRFFE